MAKKKIVNIFEDAEPIWSYIKGTGQWINVVTPDDYDKWSVNLYGDEVMDMEAELTAYVDEAVAYAKEQGKVVENVAYPYAEYDGKKYIQFKKKVYDDATEPPKLYNISGDEITGQYKKEIGGGSTVRVRAMFKPYYMGTTKTVGVSKKLLALQIIENKEYKGASGFQDESTTDNAPFDGASPDASEDY
jgi:hypothetical protein